MTGVGRRRRNDQGAPVGMDENIPAYTGFFETLSIQDVLQSSTPDTHSALTQLLEKYNDLVASYNSLKLQHNELIEYNYRPEPTGLGIEGTPLSAPQHSRFKLLKRRSYRSIRESFNLHPRHAHVSQQEQSESPLSFASDSPVAQSRGRPGTPNTRQGTAQTFQSRTMDSPVRVASSRSPVSVSSSPFPFRTTRIHVAGDEDLFGTSRSERDLSLSTITTCGSSPNRVGTDVRDRVLFCINIAPWFGVPHRVDKSWSELVGLHEACTGKAAACGEKFNAQLPHSVHFEPPYSPFRLSQRNISIDAYLESVRQHGAPFADLLFRFLGSTAIRGTPELQERAHRQGYLVRRNLDDQWCLCHCILLAKTLVLRDPFGDDEQRIDLARVRIGRQHADSYRPNEKSNLHALLILETQEGHDLYHVLCAESDSMRDSWIDTLVNAVACTNAGIEVADSPLHRGEMLATPPLNDMPSSPETSPRIPHEQPRRIRSGLFRSETASSNSTNHRRFWSGFRSFGVGHADVNEPNIFGLSLRASVQRASLPGESLALSPVPAIVRRCIDFLEQRGGILEEGIYRQSGSQIAIRILAERFSTGDFDLVAPDENAKRFNVRDYIDPHSVSGLLKLYMRELPDSVLTGALTPEFVAAVEAGSRAEYVPRIGQLMLRLPPENYSLLRMLCTHMKHIVSFSDTNKMNLKNIGIVLSPSLVIPTSLLSVFLIEYSYVFALGDHGERAPIDIEGHPVHEAGSPPVRGMKLVSLHDYSQTIESPRSPVERLE